MSGSNTNGNGPVPRVVKGTGFYTPMDLAPGESPAGANAPQPPTVVQEGFGLQTPMSVAPTEATPQQPPAQPPQTGDGNDATSG